MPNQTSIRAGLWLTASYYPNVFTGVDRPNSMYFPTSVFVARLALVAVLALAPLRADARQAPGREPDVFFLATPPDVVDVMLKFANVTPADVVYDLGCGDGAIVIAAARDYGARGVGIDIDPRRIGEARENARRSGVSHRVTFIEGDLFESDISGATVVTLYLLPTLNARVMPKLLAELRPGTRVVSHSFDMPKWIPEKRVDINDHALYFWTIRQADTSLSGTSGAQKPLEKRRGR